MDAISSFEPGVPFIGFSKRGVQLARLLPLECKACSFLDAAMQTGLTRFERLNRVKSVRIQLEHNLVRLVCICALVCLARRFLYIHHP